MIIGERNFLECCPLNEEDGTPFDMRSYLAGRRHCNGTLLGDATSSCVLNIGSITLVDLTRSCASNQKPLRELSLHDLRRPWHPSLHLVEGDDRFSLVNFNFRKHSLDVSKESRVVLSEGKDTFSQYSGTFTEDKVFKEGVFWRYHDLIKNRYFSRATPDFKEHRDIAFSKANAISRRVEYLLEDPSPANQLRGKVASRLYWDVNRHLSEEMPYILPLELGGVGAPSKFGWADGILAISPEILGVVDAAITTYGDPLDPMNRMLSSMGTRASKGFEPRLSTGRTVAAALAAATPNRGIPLDPELPTPSDVLTSHLEERGVPYPIFRDGTENHRGMVSLVERLFNIVPVSNLIRDTDRVEAFANAFVGDEPTRGSVITVDRYVHNWMDMVSLVQPSQTDPGEFLRRFPNRRALQQHVKNTLPRLFINNQSHLYLELTQSGPSLTAKWHP
jgi:hypothetical protein